MGRLARAYGLRVRLRVGQALGLLLHSQQEIQRTVPPHRSWPLTPEQRAGFIRDNVLALHVEADELLNETRWKPWLDGDGSIISRKAYLDEIADLLLFVLNLANVADATGDELVQAVLRKQARNLARGTVQS